MPKTRFVCVSDTHGYTPSEAGFKLPPGDVFIHAGDLTNTGSMAELQRTVNWISKAEYEVKIIVAGNHDTTLDPSCNAHGDSQKYLDIITSASPQIIYLSHQPAVIRLTRPEGPRTVFKVFGSPYAPRMSEAWAAFGYDSASADDGTRLWSRIPRDVDVVVTHGPPRSHLDGRGGATGCKALNQTLRLVRPSLVVCGHVHESRGAERVRWGEGPEAVAEQVDRIDLPPSGSKKQSLVDLTGKRGPRLDNGIDDPAMEGSSGSLRGKKSRNETCIINASIMGTHWPHRGGKKFNAAIVVDLELPEGET